YASRMGIPASETVTFCRKTTLLTTIHFCPDSIGTLVAATRRVLYRNTSLKYRKVPHSRTKYHA
ncbi:MAG: hypothetical protein KAT56_01245, partial [Sedimentisphaerales bacterium]|nr:hypothetical protein [Sedimentisphaerales bacterium]